LLYLQSQTIKNYEFCSNSRLEENLMPQLPFGNEDVKFSENEEVGQKASFPFI